MRKQLLWLLAILTLTALVSSAQRTPEPTAVTPMNLTAAVPSVVEPDWASAGLLSWGEVLYSTRGPLEGAPLSLDRPVELCGSSIAFQVDIGMADHRWTRYGPLQAKVEKGIIRLECQVTEYTRGHIENYMPSRASTDVLTLTGLKGNYRIFLADRQVGSMAFQGD